MSEIECNRKEDFRAQPDQSAIFIGSLHVQQEARSFKLRSARMLSIGANKGESGLPHVKKEISDIEPKYPAATRVIYVFLLI